MRRRAQIDAGRGNSTIPNVPVLFWSFRFMVGFGFWFIALFATAFWLSADAQLDRYRWFLARRASEPAAALARRRTGLDRGRIWPPALGDRGRAADRAGRVLDRARAMSCSACWALPLFYSALLVADLYLLVKYIRLGPDEAPAAGATPSDRGGVTP